MSSLSAGFIFWLTFAFSLIITIIMLIIFYVKSKKFYPLFYILSIFTYINFVAYVIDAFDFGKVGVFLMLLISAVVLSLLGVYFSKIKKEEPIAQEASNLK